jgi:hypothetical protein
MHPQNDLRQQKPPSFLPGGKIGSSAALAAFGGFMFPPTKI